jgi:hypothetical protein
MRATGQTDWENHIDMICENINNCSLDAIGGVPPASVDEMTEYRVRQAYEKRKRPFLDWHQEEDNVDRFEETPPAKRKLNLGDYVYKVMEKDPLGKSYDVQAGRLYIVKRILAAKDPIRYELCSLKGADVPGSYYVQQLIKSEPPKEDRFWQIKPQDKYKKRTLHGKKQIYVQFLHYPANEGRTDEGEKKHNFPTNGHSSLPGQWINAEDLESASRANE